MDKGFVTANALFVMLITLMSALFLLYTFNQEYLIVNSSKNNIQSFYMAESKIYLVMNKEEYYSQQLLPRLKHFIKLERLLPAYDNVLILDTDDLYEGDVFKKVSMEFSKEDDRWILRLDTSSRYFDITKKIQAKLTIINEFFEMGMPIVTPDNIQQEKSEKLTDYMLYVKENIKIPELPNSICSIEINDYEDVIIRRELNGGSRIEFYRNCLENPVKHEEIGNKDIFLMLRKNYITPGLSIISTDPLDTIILKGIIYIEGDLVIEGNLNFEGIIIFQDGNIIMDDDSQVNIKGIVLSNNCDGGVFDSEKLNVNYNSNVIERYGTYLPGFVELNLQGIKSD